MNQARPRCTAGIFAAVALLCAGARPLAAGPAAAFVTVTPAWQICSPELRASPARDYFGEYGKSVQWMIIQALRAEGICALPSFYCSGTQAAIRLSGNAELDSMVRHEPDSRRGAVTLVPVLRDPGISKHGIFTRTRKRYSAGLTLHRLGPDGTLGKPLLETSLAVKLTFRGSSYWDDVAAGTEKLRASLLALPSWRLIADGLRTARQGPAPFPAFSAKTYPKEQTRDYFAQGEVMLYQNEVVSRIEKDNFYAVGEKVKDVSDLAFRYNASAEYPEIVYAYIILPDRQVVAVDNKNFHIEQPPEALPTRVYTADRILVGNLEQLVPGSVVAYCIAFYSLRARRDAPAGGGLNAYALGSDFEIDYADTSTAWEVRVIVPQSERLYVGSRGVSYDTASFGLGGVRCHVISGNGVPLPPGIFEPFGVPRALVVRVSSVDTWSELYRPVRDSVESRIGIPAASFRAAVTDPDSAQRITLAHLRFISDSLRYVSNAFGIHTCVPAHIDSLLRSRMGDCKDFSTLLARRLRASGILAFTALVNSFDDRTIFPGPPSYDAFNHMITFVPAFNWWIDPTFYLLSPALIPEYLCGSQALVLYNTEVVPRQIPQNPDSVYRSQISYTFEVRDRDLRCSYERIMSPYGAYFLRAWLKEVPKDKWESQFFPPGGSRFSVSDNTFEAGDVDAVSDTFTVRRQFTARNAVSTIGDRVLINFPEVPAANLIETLVEVQRKSDFYVGTTSLNTVRLYVKTQKKVQWPPLPDVRERQYAVSGAPEGINRYRAEILWKRGEVSPDSYDRLRTTFLQYRDFFSSAAVAGGN